MLEQTLSQPTFNARFVSEGASRAVFATHSPRQNNLLAALPPKDYERLLPNLKPVALPPRRVVHDAGGRENCLYFLTEGIVARCDVTANGNSSVFALTGNEGVIGVVSYLGGGSTLSQATVLSAAFAYRLDADPRKSGVAHMDSLQQLLLRYTMFLIAQIGQTAACNRYHTLEQQLCRWILACMDRLPSNELTMTQELIANMFGVRREGISGAVKNLQSAGLIQTRRGHIVVLDRPGLETRVCECYGVVKREYDRLRPESVSRFSPKRTFAALLDHVSRQHG
jgi:CRP-like cAMP-binding protein